MQALLGQGKARAILSERKERTKLGLSKYTAEAAEQAAEHRDKLGIARNVRDVAAVHSTLWPEDHNERGILNVAVLTGQVNIWNSKTGLCVDGPDKGKFRTPKDGINQSEPE